MKIIFQTKEESNKERETAFLKLTGAERISSFLNLMEQVSKFPTKYKKKKTNNFLIILPSQDELGRKH